MSRDKDLDEILKRKDNFLRDRIHKCEPINDGKMFKDGFITGPRSYRISPPSGKYRQISQEEKKKILKKMGISE